MKETEMFKEIRAMDNTPEDYMKFKGMIDKYAAKDFWFMIIILSFLFILGILSGFQICSFSNHKPF